MTDTNASGNFNAGGTWVGGVVPTTTTAVIKAGHTVTVTANVAGIGANTLSAVAIQVEAGATLILNAGITLVALGDVQVSGAVTVGPGGFLDVRAIAEGSVPPPANPTTRYLTINSTGVVTANGTSTNPCRIGSTAPNSTIINGTGTLNATYTSFAHLYGMGGYYGVWPPKATVSRFHAKALWEYNMVFYGMYWHNVRVANPPPVPMTDPYINNTYYDAPYCYYKVMEYTGDPTTWQPCATLAADWLRTRFQEATPDGAVSGFHIHTRGMADDFFIGGNADSKQAAFDVSHNAQFAPDATDDGPLGGNTNLYSRNREASLVLHSYLVAKDLGQTPQPRPRYDDLVEFLYGHWEQIIDEDWVGSTDNIQHWYYIGLAFRSLWWDWTTSGDVRFIPKLIEQVNYFWDEGWDDEAEVIINDLNPDGIDAGPYPNPSADTMMLTIPVFSFLWLQTGDSIWRDRYDIAFASAVRKGYMGALLYEGKQFNEKYIWSFQGEVWRHMTPSVGGSTGGSMFAGAVIGR